MKGLGYFENRINDILSGETMHLAEMENLYDELMLSSTVKDAYHYYLLGYLKFHFPNKAEDDILEAIEMLERSISKEKNNPFAFYYLGFLKYNNKKYREALEIFESIDLVFFAERNLKWRYFKVCEMIFCCKLLLSNSNDEVCSTLIDACLFFSKVISDECEEEYNYPIDLIRSTYLVIGKRQITCRALRELCDLILRLDLRDEYHNEYDLFLSLSR